MIYWSHLLRDPKNLKKVEQILDELNAGSDFMTKEEHDRREELILMLKALGELDIYNTIRAVGV